MNSRAVYFFSDLRRHIALQSQIVLSTGAGDFTLLYRAPQTLSKLSHYSRCIFDYEKKLMRLFFPATAAENCACYLTFYSQWMQATFHACTGSFKRCQSCPTISGVSVTNQELRWLLFSATRGGKLRLRPHILLAMDTGDLPRLYRVLSSLSNLSYFPR